MTRRLAREEGLLVGGSCGLAMVAVEVAKEYGRDTTIVVLLPDGGRGYLSKVYNDDWMRDHGFLPRRGAATVVDVLGGKAHHDTPPLVTVASHERVKEAIDRLHAYSVSQLPVVHGEDPADLSSVVGSIQEGTLLERLFRKPEVLDAQVVDVMDPRSPPSSSTSRPRPPSSPSKGRSTAVLVTDHGRAVGVMTRSDLLDHLATRNAAGSRRGVVLGVPYLVPYVPCRRRRSTSRAAQAAGPGRPSPWPARGVDPRHRAAAGRRPRPLPTLRCSGAAIRPSPSGSTRPWPASASDRPRYHSGLLAALDAGQRQHELLGAGGRLWPLLLSPFVLAELDYLLLGRVGAQAGRARAAGRGRGRRL